MRVFAPLLVILVVTLTVVVIDLAGPLGVRQTTVRDVLADPAAFDGVVVSIGVTSFESGPDAGTLVYRKFASQPPQLVVEFARPHPARRPTVITGRVVNGKPIRVTDSRPAPPNP